MKRWTIKELKEISDKNFIIEVLNERRSTLTNCYSPLYTKIAEVIKNLESNPNI